MLSSVTSLKSYLDRLKFPIALYHQHSKVGLLSNDDPESVLKQFYCLEKKSFCIFYSPVFFAVRMHNKTEKHFLEPECETPKGYDRNY